MSRDVGKAVQRFDVGAGILKGTGWRVRIIIDDDDYAITPKIARELAEGLIASAERCERESGGNPSRGLDS